MVRYAMSFLGKDNNKQFKPGILLGETVTHWLSSPNPSPPSLAQQSLTMERGDGRPPACCWPPSGAAPQSTGKPKPVASLCLFLFPFFDLRALHLWGRCSIAWATPPNLFTLVILDTRSYFLPRPAWTIILLFYTFCFNWDDRHVPSHPTFFWDEGVL
jgi:hypothetical protein